MTLFSRLPGRRVLVFAGLFVALVGTLIVGSGKADMDAPGKVDASKAGMAASGKVDAAAEAEPAPKKPAVEQFLEIVPDGGSISYDDFIKKAGTNEIASFISKTRATLLSRKAGHVTLDCKPGVAVSSPQGIDVNVEKRVEFDMTSGPGTVKLDAIKGVTVTLPAGLGTATVKEVTLLKNADGSVTVSGSVRLRFIPRVPFSFTIDPKSAP